MTSLYRVLKHYDGTDMPEGPQGLFTELMEPEAPEVPEVLEPSGEEPETEDSEEEAEGNIAEWAEQILEAARLGAEQIKEEARQEGYEQGVKEGYAAGADEAREEHRLRIDREMLKLQERIALFVKEVEVEKERLLEEYLDDLKNISLAIGEKIVQVSLKSSEEVIERMIMAAVEKLKKTAWAKIYIGRGQEMMDIHGDADFLKSLSKLAENVKIVMMDQEEIGTCIVELPDEIIDISVGTQLENIKEILNNARL